ncbi:MAG: hypothetical protein ACK56I_15650, partial [bacterium]
AASDWLFIKRQLHWNERFAGSPDTKLIGRCRRDFSIYRKVDVLFKLKIREAFKKFKNLPRPLLRPRSINFHQHFLNLSHKTVPLEV